MSCHISALCIALPCPPIRTGGDHFGERNSQRVKTNPYCTFKAPTTPQPLPPLCGGWGQISLRRAPFTSLPVSLTAGGVQHLQPHRFMVKQHTISRRRSLHSGCLFRFRSVGPHIGSILHGGVASHTGRLVLCW